MHVYTFQGTRVRRSGKPVLSFYHGGPRNQNRLLVMVASTFTPLSYLPGPINLFLRQDLAIVSQAVFKPAILLPQHLGAMATGMFHHAQPQRIITVNF